MLTSAVRHKQVIEQELTLALVTRLRKIEYNTLPPYAVTIAKHCLLDWLGLVIASTKEPSVRLVVEEGARESATGECTAVGFERKFGPLWASFINGTAGHALDFDDVLGAMNGHPTVPVMPALAAAAESGHLSGAEFINAFVVGVEAEALIGGLLGPAHYAHGFHATGTVGTLGAAAGVARLLNLTEDQWAVALALAGTQAAGLKSMFGTMGKPFHAGKAAFGGMLAAHLALRGYSGPPNILSDEQGFLAPHSSSPKLVASALPASAELAIAGILFKYSASCYLTHSTIEAARSLADRFDHDTKRIKSVIITVPSGHLSVCNIQNPRTGLEGKFSLKYTAALVLAGIPTNVESFTEEMTTRADLTALQNKITVCAKDQFSNSFQSACAIILSDDTRLTTSSDVSVPISLSLLPTQWDRLLIKFMHLAQPVLGNNKAQELAELVANTETLGDMATIMRFANNAV